MAKMIPAIYSIDTGSRAEENLFYKIQSCLDATYTVFHSYNLFQRNLEKKLIEAEIDFLIISQSFGFLVLEVKGGAVSFDGTRWLQNSIPLEESPYHQAQRNKYAVLSFLEKKLGRKISVALGHAVCFPDVYSTIQTLTPDAEPGITITGREIPHIDSVLPAVMSNYRKVSAHLLPKQEYEMARKALMPEFEYGAGLADMIGAAEQIFFKLTEEQCGLLDFIGDRKRVLIKGGAGTGKTVLALKKAKELAHEGKKVLLLCFNMPLADILQKSIVGQTENITASNYHSFCLKLLQDAGIELKTRSDNQFWRYEIPDAILKLLEKQPVKYDAIIVDEGQDFIENYWITIESMLNEKGYLYIFYDPDQNLYEGDLLLPINDQPFVLSINCRNTRRIAEALKEKTGHEIKTKTETPDGAPVTEICCSSDLEFKKELSKILHHLISEEKIPHSRIVIIGGHKIEHTCLANDSTVGNFVIEHEPQPDSQSIRYYTYMRFKGCEADAVIVLGYDPDDPGWARPSALYTAMSRAKHLLYLLCKKKA